MQNDLTSNYADWECRAKLQELFDGRSVVLPSSEEHARYMLLVAQNYIDQRVQATFDIVKNGA